MTFGPSSQIITKTVTVTGTGTAATTVNGLFGPQNTSILTSTVTIAGPQDYPAGATMVLSNSRVNFNSDAGGTGIGKLSLSVVVNSTHNFNTTQHLALLDIQNALAVLTVGGESGSEVVVTSAVQFGGTGRLNLTQHGLVVNYTGGSYLSTVRSAIVKGFNGGAWNGDGVTSSIVALTPGTALGYGEA